MITMHCACLFTFDSAIANDNRLAHQSNLFSIEQGQNVRRHLVEELAYPYIVWNPAKFIFFEGILLH